MASVLHLHSLLDTIESILMEQAIKEEDRDRLNDELYRPEVVVTRGGKKAWEPPPGFDPDSIEEGFDALAGAM